MFCPTYTALSPRNFREASCKSYDARRDVPDKGFDLSTHKMEIVTVSARLLAILIAYSLFFWGCADTRQVSDSDSNSVLSKQEGDHEVHGEMGAMYGHTAR